MDVSERWTRPEHRQYLSAGNDETFSFIRRKCEACHLVLLDGSACDDPQAIDEALIDNMDPRLIGFVSGSLNAAYQHLSSLGFRSARPSFVGTAATEKNANG